MKDVKIRILAERFRTAIEAARDDDLFKRDSFDRFPRGCCGDTCCLLAEFFRSYGIESIYVWGEDSTYQTHAWLVINDERVNVPDPEYLELPNEMRRVMNLYSNNAYNKPISVSHYTESDVERGLIVDITSDQFGENRVYVGYIYSFYKQFDFREANSCTDLYDDRLMDVYQKICRYID